MFSPTPSLRVLFVVGYLRGNDGITSHLMDLAAGLQAHGWTVALASCMKEELAHTVRGPSWFEERGVRHYYVPFPDSHRPDYRTLDIVRAWPTLRKALRDFRPDLLHLHALSLAPYACLQRLLGGVPYVTTCHIEPRTDSLQTRLGASLSRVSPSFFGNRYVAVSTEMQVALSRGLGVPNSRICTIHHGVDDDHFRPPTPEERSSARAAFGIDPDDFTVSTIGRLNPVKRQDLLIEATARLRERGIRATALIAGSGDWEDFLHRQIADVGATDYVKMLGFSDARTVLWASDTLALLSSREAFALVIPEAMFCGVVPVRTPAAGVHDQIQDGVNGFIVPFDAPEALANRLGELATDPTRRAEMGTAARRFVQHRYTTDAMVRNTISLYEEVLETAGTSSPVPSLRE
jgi:glycosyltransferase involved in cell wall biosynthesis